MNKTKYIALLFGILFCCKTALAVPLLIHTSDKNYSFDVEIADTPQEQIRGLMFRTQLSVNNGMIFISETDQIWTMWMKNTLIPLDMLFFDRKGQIQKIIPNAQPLDLTPLSSDVPVAGVLEINGGIAEKYNIQPGDYLFLPSI